MTSETVAQMIAEGMTDAEIGAVFGRERRTVQSFRRTHGIPAARPIGKTRRGEAAPVGAAVSVVPQTDSPLRAKPITIAEFLLNKKRAVCPVCQLKEPVKALVQDAKKKGERTADILEYLQVCHRITITPREFASHVSGRHDP